jgi:hypothetical protein
MQGWRLWRQEPAAITDIEQDEILSRYYLPLASLPNDECFIGNAEEACRRECGMSVFDGERADRASSAV